MRRVRGIGLGGAIVIAVLGFFAWEIHDKGWTLFFTLIMLFLELVVLKQAENRLFAWRPSVKF